MLLWRGVGGSHVQEDQERTHSHVGVQHDTRLSYCMLPTPATKLASGAVSSPSNPSHRPLDIDKLYYTRAILSVQWSVDGEHLYFDTNITGRYNIWAVPSNRGWPVQLTVNDERTLLQDPSPDGRYLLYPQDIQGNEKP